MSASGSVRQGKMQRFSIALLLFVPLIGGVAMWWLQTRALYFEVAPSEVELLLTNMDGEEIALEPDNLTAIDSESSPIRFRACFEVDITLDALDEHFKFLPEASPRIGPRWFDCFNAQDIAAMLDDQSAKAFLGEKDVHWGIDRIIAITTDGRGYAWHDFNHCGEAHFDGQPLPEGCPPPPE